MIGTLWVPFLFPTSYPEHKARRQTLNDVVTHPRFLDHSQHPSFNIDQYEKCGHLVLLEKTKLEKKSVREKTIVTCHNSVDDVTRPSQGFSTRQMSPLLYVGKVLHIGKLQARRVFCC